MPGGGDVANKNARDPKSSTPVSESNQIVLANWAYGYHYKTGKNFKNTGQNDGWNFRGRGLFQITGRSTYGKIQEKINAFASDSGIDILKKYDSPDNAISVANGWMTPAEAAVTGMADWFKDNMFIAADETGKLSDDTVVDSIVKIINEKTPSYPERRTWYRGGTAGDLVVNESESTKSIFKVSECGKVEEPLNYENSDLKIQKGIEWLLTKAIDQTDVEAGKPYKVPYSNDQNRTTEAGENTMDCSELVCRFLNKIEWSSKPMAAGTAILYEFMEKHSNLLQKHDDTNYKPKPGDIFLWKNLSGGMGHTGIVIAYDEVTDVVTTVEAISSSEIPYGLSKKLPMKGVTKLKWLRDSSHLIAHPLKNSKGHNVTTCRFYTPIFHHSKVDKQLKYFNSGGYEFIITKK